MTAPRAVLGMRTVDGRWMSHRVPASPWAVAGLVTREHRAMYRLPPVECWHLQWWHRGRLNGWRRDRYTLRDVKITINIEPEQR